MEGLMTKRKYKQRTADEKVAILRLVLVEKQQVSKVCEDHGVSPALFYEWQRLFFENGAAAFAKDGESEKRELARKVETLEAKLAKKDAVIAEVTEEFVKLKKELGEL